MKITRNATAGIDKADDALVEIAPGTGGIQIEIQSKDIKQYGYLMEREIKEVLQEFQVTNANVSVIDHGAVTFVLKARLEAAILRAGLEEG